MVQCGSRLRSSLGGSGVVCGGDVSVVCLLPMCLLLKLLSVSSLVCVSESLVVSVAVVELSSECFGWINSALISLGVGVGDVVDGVIILVIVSDSSLVLLSSLCCVSESLIVSVSVVSSVSGCFWWMS